MPAPTTGTPTEGVYAKLWIAEALPFDESSAQCLEFLSEGLRQTVTLYHSDGVRGTRSRGRERCRESSRVCSGPITINPTKTELRTLLPWILGTNETGAGSSGDPYTYILAEGMQEFQVLILRVEPSASHTDEVFLYEGCRVSSATFSASVGGPLTLTLNIEAETETPFANAAISVAHDGSTSVMSGGASGRSIPSSTVDTNSIFMFHDTGTANGSLVLGNADRECFSWSLTIDNELDTTRQMNSLTRTSIPSMGRRVSMSAVVPFTAAEDDLYDMGVNSASPDMNVNLVKFYNELGANDDVFQLTLGTWNVESVTPTVNGKGEVALELNGDVYRKNTSTAKAEISATIWTT